MQSNIIPEGFKDDVSFQVAAEHRYKNIIIDCKFKYYVIYFN